MAIGFSDPRSGYSGLMHSDIYDGQRYYSEQERRYREEMERQRNAAMQNVYDHNTQMYRGMSAQQHQEEPKSVKAAQPVYEMNKKLLLLEN
jgi:hypothetical protein